MKRTITAGGKIFKLDSGQSNESLPSLLLTLAKTGPWLLVSCEELLNDDGGRLVTSGLSHTSVNQSQSRKDRDQLLESWIISWNQWSNILGCDVRL